jgi:hypothetical protein
VAGFGFACLAFAAICMHLMFKALSERVGFKVTWRNAPPYRYKAFGAWCRSHGLNPATGQAPGAHLARERTVHRAPAHRAHPQPRRDELHAELRTARRQTS